MSRYLQQIFMFRKLWNCISTWQGSRNPQLVFNNACLFVEFKFLNTWGVTQTWKLFLTFLKKICKSMVCCHSWKFRVTYSVFQISCKQLKYGCLTSSFRVFCCMQNELAVALSFLRVTDFQFVWYWWGVRMEGRLKSSWILTESLNRLLPGPLHSAKCFEEWCVWVWGNGPPTDQHQVARGKN